jgi:hypothetical protein
MEQARGTCDAKVVEFGHESNARLKKLVTDVLPTDAPELHKRIDDMAIFVKRTFRSHIQQVRHVRRYCAVGYDGLVTVGVFWTATERQVCGAVFHTGRFRF